MEVLCADDWKGVLASPPVTLPRMDKVAFPWSPETAFYTEQQQVPLPIECIVSLKFENSLICKQQPP